MNLGTSEKCNRTLPDLLAGRHDLPGAGNKTRHMHDSAREGTVVPFPSRAAGNGRNIGDAIAPEWPLRDCMAFGALPGAVPCARLHTRLVLAEWGHADLAEEAELVVSELVTNAIAASQCLDGACDVRLWLNADATQVMVSVWDANPCLPALVEADDLAESGRGLHLVDALAVRWEAYPVPDRGGKIVQAVLAAQEPQEPAQSPPFAAAWAAAPVDL